MKVNRFVRLLAVLAALYVCITLYTQPQATVVSQQTQSCPAIIEEAINRVGDICAATGRNELCYGNLRLRAQPRAGLNNFQFSVGDITEIDNLQRVSLSRLNVERNEWGVSLMRLQADLPDLLPGQNVNLLMFGGVEISPMPAAEASESSTDLWQRADGFTQAFRLQTAVGGIRCEEISSDGILVQSPEGARWVTLSINGVDIRFGSTLFLQALPGESMNVYTLEGTAFVAVPHIDETHLTVAVAGTKIDVPLDENLLPSGEPTLPEAYTDAETFGLPVDLLDTPIEIAPPLDEFDLEEIRMAIEQGTLAEWIDENYADDDSLGEDWWIEPAVIDELIDVASNEPVPVDLLENDFPDDDGEIGSEGDDTTDDTGGDAGDDTGGDTGGDAGDDTGGDTGGDAGDDTGGDTGGDAGGDTGDDTSGDAGGDTGDDSGDDDTGGDTGGDTDGDSETPIAEVGSDPSPTLAPDPPVDLPVPTAFSDQT